MVTVTQNLVVVTITVLVSLLVMAGLNLVWPREKRRQYNDLVGWQLTVLGTTYAVILGFMLYAVWTSLGEANLNVDLEANALVDIYRLADGLPEPQRTELQSLARSYVDTVIDREWPQMVRGEVPEQSTAISTNMWKTVMSVKPVPPTEANAQLQAMSEFGSLAQHRLIRILESRTRLPNALWCVLLVGGGLTIISACLFGAESVKLHALHVLCFSLLVALSLVAIANIHRPFYGLVHVTDYAFQMARQSMRSR
jgi:hypothetical protein